MTADSGNKKKIILIVATMAAVIAAGCIYSYWNPAEHNWFPRCPILMTTGLKCPGCGSQRMVHALLNGHIAEAFRYNALLTLLMPLILALVVVEPMRNRFPRIYMALNAQWLIVTVMILMGLWTILRNIFGW